MKLNEGVTIVLKLLCDLPNEHTEARKPNYKVELTAEFHESCADFHFETIQLP